MSTSLLLCQSVFDLFAMLQEATTSGMSDGSATFRARGNSYLANAPAEFATTPISSMTSTKSAYTESNADKKRRRLWTPAEDLELISAVEKCGEGNWTSVLKCPYNFDRSASQLSQVSSHHFTQPLLELKTWLQLPKTTFSSKGGKFPS